MTRIKKSLPLTISLSEKKKQLILSIKEALTECSRSESPVAESANYLNSKNVRAPKGKEWTSKSLGKYISSNRDWLMDPPTDDVKPQLYAKEEIIRGFLDKMADSLKRSESDSLVFIAINRGILDRVKHCSTSQDMSLGDAFDAALNSWLKEKKARRRLSSVRVVGKASQPRNGGLSTDLADYLLDSASFPEL